jgi:hypothetical protein
MSALELECGDLPRAAIDASFAYSPSVMGGEGSLRFSADELPAGLAISESTGQITGVPTEAGERAFELTVTDGTATARDTCSITIHPALGVDLALDTVPYCVRGSQTLLDFVVEGTGDGNPIRCDHMAGTGNGKIPDGVELEPDTCAITGSVTEQRLGTWAFMVRGTQSEAEVWIPYCVTREQGLDYEIRVEHTTAGADNTLVPLMRTYDASAALDVGEPGDPRFEIIDETACSGSSCFYGYAFSVNSSPFSIDTISFNPRSLLHDPSTDEPIGFTHGFSVGGPPVGDAFRRRPWVVNFDLDYCLSSDADLCTCPDDDDSCNAAQKVRDNGAGNLEFSIIMVPE